MHGDGRRAEHGQHRSCRHFRCDERPAVADVDDAVRRGAGVQVHPDQPGDVGRERAVGDLRGSARLHDAAAFEHDDPVREQQGFDRVVGDEQRRPGELAEVFAQLALDLGAGLYVQGRERLVEQQRGRLAGQRAGERDALRLPAGQLPRMPAGELGEAEAVRATFCAVARASCLRDAARAQSERDVVERPAGARRAGDPGTRRRAGAAAARRTRRGRCRRARRRRAGSPRCRAASRPATARSNVDLPAPFGPRTASTSPGAALIATSSSNAPRLTRPSTSRVIAALTTMRPGAAICRATRRGRSARRPSAAGSAPARRPAPRRTPSTPRSAAVWVHPGVLPPNNKVAPNSPSARAQHNTVPATIAGSDERQRHAREDTTPGRAEGGRGLLDAAIGDPESALDGDDEERHGHERLRDDDRRKGERQVVTEDRVDRIAEQPVAAEGIEQRDTPDHRGQHQRDRHHRPDDPYSRQNAAGRAPRPAARRAPARSPSLRGTTTMDSRSAVHTCCSR